MTFINRSPPLGGRGHRLRGPNELFLIVFTFETVTSKVCTILVQQ